MTYTQGYKAALEAAAKLAEGMISTKERMLVGLVQLDIADAIRALPVPEDAGDMVMVPREPTEAMIETVARALHAEEWANVAPRPSYLQEADRGEYWGRSARAAYQAMIEAKE